MPSIIAYHGWKCKSSSAHGVHWLPRKGKDTSSQLPNITNQVFRFFILAFINKNLKILPVVIHKT